MVQRKNAELVLIKRKYYRLEPAHAHTYTHMRTRTQHTHTYNTHTRTDAHFDKHYPI